MRQDGRDFVMLVFPFSSQFSYEWNISTLNMEKMTLEVVHRVAKETKTNSHIKSRDNIQV